MLSFSESNSSNKENIAIEILKKLSKIEIEIKFYIRNT